MTRASYLADLESSTTNIQQKVLRTLAKSPYPLTADEIAAQLGKHYMSVRPRLSELKVKGLVFAVEDDKAVSVHGRAQKLWALKENPFAFHP